MNEEPFSFFISRGRIKGRYIREACKQREKKDASDDSEEKVYRFALRS